MERTDMNLIMKLHRFIDADERELSYATERFREIRTSFPITLDSGEISIIEGFRVQHRLESMPMFGGLRIHPSFSPEDGKRSALKNTMKSSLLEMGVLGSSGGIKMNISDYSKAEIDKTIDSYIGSIIKDIGQSCDTFGLDVNVDNEILRKVRTAYFNRRNDKNMGMRDPVSLIDLSGNDRSKAFNASGISVAMSIEEWARRSGVEIDSMTVVIQGFGEAGYNAGSILKDKGAVIVGIQSNDGCYYNPYGIDLDEFRKNLREESIDGSYEGAKKINIDTFLTIRSDVFISSACENIVCRDSAALLNVKCVTEAADGAVDEEADEILKKRNVYVLPDIVALAGGIFYGNIGSILGKKNLSIEKAEKRLQKKIETAINMVEKTAQDKKLTNKESAVVCAANNLVKFFG